MDSLNSEVFVVFQLGAEKLQTPSINSSRGVWGNDTWQLTPTDGSTELEAVVYQKQTLRWASIAGMTCGSAPKQLVPCCWGVLIQGHCRFGYCSRHSALPNFELGHV